MTCYNHRHTPDERINCPHCTFRVKDRCVATMNVHIDGSHSQHYVRQFGCAHCTRMFVFDRSLNNHLYKHELRNQLACKFCNLKFTKRKELQYHAREIHGNIDFDAFKENNTHLPIVVSDNIKTNIKSVCDICNTEHECFQTLKEHMNQKHSDGKKKCCHYFEHKTTQWSYLRLESIEYLYFSSSTFKLKYKFDY